MNSNSFQNVFSRQTSQNLILALIHKNTSLSKYELSKLTGLSTTAITSHINQMTNSGLLYESGTGTSSGGRKPTLLSLKGDFGYMIGIDFSAGGIYTCVLNFTRQTLYANYVPLADHNINQVIVQIYEEIHKAINTSGISENKILGIGVGIPGYADYKKGLLHVYTQLKDWKNINFKELISQEFRHPLFFTGTINAMANAYQSIFKRGFCEDTVILAVRSGLKASVIINNSITYGKNNFFGEIGHTKVVGSNRICRCGKKGCYDTEVTYIGMCMKVEEGMRVGKFGYIKDKIKQTGNPVNIDMIIEACNEGDTDTIQLVDDMIVELTRVISWILSMFDPAGLVLASKLTHYTDFMSKIKRVVNESENRYRQHKALIEPWPFGELTGAMGCAALVSDSLYGLNYICGNSLV